MKKSLSICCGVLFAIGFAILVAAQAPSGAPKPGPEHEKLGYFVGTWLSEANMKPSPYGPGGKASFTETCDWMPGNFALMCKTSGDMFGSKVTGASILSYDMGEKRYVYFESNSMGENNYATGSIDGDTWTWASETKMNGALVKSRFSMKIASTRTPTPMKWQAAPSLSRP